ncbi:MAG: hypothetical protein ACR2PZ_26575 [Pseudomonadales bacterium]
MKANRTAVATILVFGFALMPFAQAQTGDKPARVISTTIQRGAIVESVDKTTRELKLLDSQGNRFTVVADERVRNFDQIEPRDRIIAEYVESVAVVVAPADSIAPIGEGGVVAVAPAGDKPSIEGIGTRLIIGSIESINVTDRLVTIALEGGEVRTVKVLDSERLAMVGVGDQVRLRITQALAVSVRRPGE